MQDDILIVAIEVICMDGDPMLVERSEDAAVLPDTQELPDCGAHPEDKAYKNKNLAIHGLPVDSGNHNR